MKFDWKTTLSTVAPALAAAFGGPLAGVATKMAAEALGLPGGTESDIAQAVASGDSDVLVKLKEVDTRFQAKMKELDVEVQRIDAGDRGSARSLAVARGLIPQAILSVIFVVAFATALYAIFSGNVTIPESMKMLAGSLLGMLAAGLTQIMNFWFGSSSGSKEKTGELVRLKGE